MIHETSKRRWRILAAVTVGTGAALFAWYPISDGDIFWHLAAAREMLQTGSFLFNDPFCFTSQQSWQWINLHWLYQFCMYGFHRVAGWWGILIANSLLFGAAAALLFHGFARGKGMIISALFWLVALYEVKYFVPHRPIALSLLFLSLFLVCLEQFRRTRKTRFLLFLVPIQIAWTNCQPLFVLGPVVYGAFFAGDLLDRTIENGRNREAAIDMGRPLWMIVLAGMLLLVAALVNPYGYHAYELAFMHYGRIDPSLANLFAANIPENTPLLWLIAPSQARVLYATAGITVAAVLCGTVAYRSIRFSLLFVSLCMLFLAFRAQRNIVLYFFAALPFIGALLPVVYRTIRTRFRKQRLLIAVAGALVLALPVLHAVAEHGAMLKHLSLAGPLAPFSFPKGSVAYLEEHPVDGKMFNADRYGGYLTWYRYPEHKVFVDTRYAVRPPAFFAEYLAIIDNKDLFGNACRKHEITAALFPVALTQRYVALARSLIHDPAWRMVVADGAEVLFVCDSLAQTPAVRLDDAATVDSISRALRERWRESPPLREEALRYLFDFVRVAKQAWSEKGQGDTGD